MHKAPLLVFDGWSEHNELYPGILKLRLLASMKEYKNVLDRNIKSVLQDIAWGCIEYAFAKSWVAVTWRFQWKKVI